LQQVGGGAGIAQRVHNAPPLNPPADLAQSTLQGPIATRSGTLIPPRVRPRQRTPAYGRKLGYAVFATLSGALAFSLLTDGGRQTRNVATLLPSKEQVFSWMGLRVDQVALNGQRFTSDADVFDAIDLPNVGSLLSLDSSGMRNRIEELPWVGSAAVSRVYPGTLDVRITERKPTALWRKGGRDYLIDDTGRTLSAIPPGGPRPRLPRVSGEDAPAQTKALIDLVLRYPAIANRFELAERVGGRRWTLHLKDRVTIHLAAGREAAAFAALSSDGELAKLLTGHDLIVDLRTRGRITVRTAPQGTSAAPAAGQS
jgi:cell division protein FtsQ